MPFSWLRRTWCRSPSVSSASGTISSAAVRGLCRSSNAQIVLSPRNAAKAKALEQEFETVRIATTTRPSSTPATACCWRCCPARLNRCASLCSFEKGSRHFAHGRRSALRHRKMVRPRGMFTSLSAAGHRDNAGTTIVTPPEPRTVAVFEKLGGRSCGHGRPVQTPPSDDLRDGRPLRETQNGPGLACCKWRRRDGGFRRMSAACSTR